MANEHIGSGFDDFLKEDGLYEEAQNTAIKRVIAFEIEQQMKAQHINKNKMAEMIKSSCSQVDRLLDPNNTKVQLDTMQRAAAGCRLVISLKPAASGYKRRRIVA